jgi:membrane protein
VPPLLIGLLGSLGYLGDVIGGASVRQIEDRCSTPRRRC